VNVKIKLIRNIAIAGEYHDAGGVVEVDDVLAVDRIAANKATTADTKSLNRAVGLGDDAAPKRKRKAAK
jgi:hypothetical protein